MVSESPRLEDVARDAGVSLATASRVLGGSSYPVSAQLRERVLRAAAALHYVPNAHARALASAGSTTVGLVVHDISDPYFAEIAKGALRVAEERGRLVLICNTYRDPQRECAYLAELGAQRVAAVVLAGSGFTDPALEHNVGVEVRALRELGIAVALIGRHGTGRRRTAGRRADTAGTESWPRRLPSVRPDNRGGAVAAARHLRGLGHQQIGILTGPLALTTMRDRLDGALGELKAAGIRPVLVEGDLTREGGATAVRRLLTDHPATTAVLALSDVVAIGALHALRECGRRIPEELTLVGFDDVPAARDVVPELTTVSVPMVHMGALAVGAALDGESSSVVRLLPTTLVVRRSCAPPRDG